ncbi:hypothetical protein JRO89_XS03G0317000 [Xanthoceras sorbifolium]|uniref:Protein kinase domain-containing protein n=1 Tax=Xanthoceras sorbifolium TaxID=99658 RepID=A0ABQ8IDC6_9ROSI|nr:hypothetical protein JRO89_XS03G0317000 [Xanthoceras sorbifolium]
MQPENILFDEQNIAEVPDFTLSESISEGKTHVSGRVAGALGLIAPGYMLIGLCNEKSDVFSFGVLLLVLLTGQRIYDRSRRETGDDYWLLPHVKKYNENDRFYEIVDPAISLDMDCHEMGLFLRRNNDLEKVEKTAFLMRNGEILLEKLIASCNGKRNPIRNFSSEEIKQATNDYDTRKVTKTDSLYELYGGFLRDRPISVMKFKTSQEHAFE